VPEDQKLTTAFHLLAEKITVTRLDAARRQLRTAITLWFADGDQVSIHTLAAVAHQVLHDLNRAKKGPPMLFDAPWIRDEVRKQYVGILKNDSNFFKHADKRGAKSNPADSVDFNSGLSEMFMVMSIYGLQYLGEQIKDIERAFLIWTAFQKPHLLTDAGRKFYEDGVPIEIREGLRQMTKHKFLKQFLEVGRRTRRGESV